MTTLFEKYARKLTNLFCNLSVIMMLGIMFIGAADVIGRYVFNYPLRGTFEFSEILLAGVVFFGMAYTQSVGGHVSIDSVMNTLRPRKRAFISSIISLISLFIFGIMSWQGGVKAYVSWEGGRYIDIVRLPIAPFEFFVAIGMFLVCLELIIKIIKSIKILKMGV
jgi:TRAP-type transport system small permease protein